jgi:hypothetical protein
VNDDDDAVLAAASRLARGVTVQDDLDEDWRTAVAEQSPNGRAERVRRVRVTPACDIEPLPVHWVWADRIPVGEIVMTPGRGGVGKSTFHAWLIAHLTRGTLPGIHFGTPRSCFIAAREDSWQRTIVPRLIAAGADTSLVYRADVIAETDRETTLVLPTDLPGLEVETRRLAAVLLSVDPLLSAVDGKYDSHKDREVREALEPLKDFAERTGCVVLGNAHYSKGNSRDALTLMMGSAAFGNVPRAVLGFARDEDAEDGSRVLSQVKNNLGREDLPSLKYTIEETTVETRAGAAPVGRLVMQGESDRHVRDILGSHADDGDRGATDELVELLTAMLVEAGGEIPAADGMKRLRATGSAASDATVYRARCRAGIKAQKPSFGSGWVWTLAAEDFTKIPKIPPSVTGKSWKSSRNLGEADATEDYVLGDRTWPEWLCCHGGEIVSSVTASRVMHVDELQARRLLSEAGATQVPGRWDLYELPECAA